MCSVSLITSGFDNHVWPFGSLLLFFKGTPSELGYQGVDDDEEDMYPLHLAAQYKRVNIVRTLLSRGANVDISSGDGRTHLWYALNGCPAGFFDRDVNLVVDCGLSFLLSSEAIEIEKLLRDAGADPFGADPFGGGGGGGG